MQRFEQEPEISYHQGYLNPNSADTLLDNLEKQLEWRQDSIHLYGRWVDIPRLQAFIADPGISYTYSGLKLTGRGFPASLESLRRRLEEEFAHPFNAVLANLYRNGQDSMGWHSDDEPELGEHPVIASISLGYSRSFKFRPKKGGASWGIELEHGSLLWMGAGVQSRWQHSLPKRARCNGPRVNLTFRHIGNF